MRGGGECVGSGGSDQYLLQEGQGTCVCVCGCVGEVWWGDVRGVRVLVVVTQINTCFRRDRVRVGVWGRCGGGCEGGECVGSGRSDQYLLQEGQGTCVGCEGVG